jgi:hypothetical protein
MPCYAVALTRKSWSPMQDADSSFILGKTTTVDIIISCTRTQGWSSISPIQAMHMFGTLWTSQRLIHLASKRRLLGSQTPNPRNRSGSSFYIFSNMSNCRTVQTTIRAMLEMVRTPHALWFYTSFPESHSALSRFQIYYTQWEKSLIQGIVIV